ncbi:bifunctional DNA primase/polymerase [Pirellulales bacterium]|nr:bifunctional DNA primase/polymerase [Pirellulales bacterium]
MSYGARTSTEEPSAIRPALGDELDFSFHWAFEAYRERGFPVIPMRGKQPALRSWKEFQSRRPRITELAAWFGEGAPERFNLAVVTGNISGVVVVDSDCPHLGREWGARHPTPLIATTGRGGFHHYYRHPGFPVRNRVRINGLAQDLRGDGGLCLLPPSVHPETGKCYEWMTPISQVSFDDIPAFDEGWFPRQPPPTPKNWIPFAKDDRNLTRVRAYIRKIRSIQGQGGSNACYRAAAHLREAGLSPEETLCELKAWNQEPGCAEPPWTDAELRHKVASVHRLRS